MKYISDLNLQGKRVFIRADLNVPFDETGNISDDMRIRASLPTIRHAVEHGGKVVVASHLGRPKGQPNPKYSLAPVAVRLGELLGRKVLMAPDCVGPEVLALQKAQRDDEVLLLENLRFHSEEEKNDPSFAKALAKLADVYLNDAFATAHRAHASTSAMVAFVKEKAGGYTLRDEIAYFAKAFHNPERPLVAIFGGAKVSSKIAAIKNVGARANSIIVGGAMANTFFAEAGHQVGKSLCEQEMLAEATAARKALAEANCKLVLPVDVVVASEMKAGVETRDVAVDAIPSDQMALDIGPKSIELFAQTIAGAKTIIWNGPMGAFEIPEFSRGTYRLVEALSNSKALTVVGGGDTDAALHACHAFDRMSYVSTAGGAFLTLLEGKALPAVEALEA